MDLKLENQTAFITASSGGIGKASPGRWRGKGETVIINGRSAAAL